MTRDRSDHTARTRLMARMRSALLRNDLAALREAAHELRALSDSTSRRNARVGLRRSAPHAPDPVSRPPADDAS
jgi:hypothetical protein